MPGKRISELTALSGAASANNDDLVIFDSGAGETKRISRSQLAEGMQSDVQVFSNKTINLGLNTLTGTTAQFNTALSDNDFATQAGYETLTNKTFDSANNTLTVNYKEARVETSDASRTHLFTTVAALLADTGTYTTYAAGQIVEAGGFRYEVAASGATDHHVTTAGGVKLYVLPENGVFHDAAFGVNRDDATDNHAAMQVAVNAAAGATLRTGNGTARISGAIQLPTTITIQGVGSSVLKMTGTNSTFLYGNNNLRVKIRDVFFEGNQTGLGGTGASGGSGIVLKNAEYVEVTGCYFDKIGVASGSTHSVCIGVSGKKVVIQNNNFLPLCRSTTGADIGIGTTTDTVISGNISFSAMDAFVSISAVNFDPAGLDVIRHSVTGNIAYRDNENARSAILAMYDAQPGEVAITGNVIEGFVWCGVYMSAGVAATTTEPSGGATISGNIIRFCAGSGTITHSIYVSGGSGTTVSGNLIEYSGYRRDKVARGSSWPGAIGVVQHTKGVAITGNTIRDCHHTGISLSSSPGGIENVVVSGNSILDHFSDGISLLSNSPGVQLRNIRVQGNVLQTQHNANGVLVLQSNGGLFDNVVVADNNILCSASGNTAYGIYAHNRFPGRIEGNVVEGHSIGIRILGGGDRSLLRTLLVKGNEYRNCAFARQLSSNNSRQISLDDRFINCTSLGLPVDLIGTQIGVNASGDILVEVSLTATPPNGEWLVGDRVLNLSAAASGFIGWVCTTTGSPGTWKTYGAISA